ncbi:MAG TPA: YeeE/YedE thiosulfate transporter family protein [Planctomycetaceae bacterium]|nr:YeeE/YedE thiosulfate transporter family protein [Planctomycetaceae bacterium]HQZ66238.1 YeeE/YedE thiosulfate transporter family protein [Planctomycetaceae bacterium]HRA87891.1 YeeE/YedE thiosulfate transporter family protein [Planctomycetaceae bacterium]
MNTNFHSLQLLAKVDPLQYPGPAWSPYLVGGLIGVLSMFTFYFSNKPLGASTAYARIAGMLGNMVAPRHTQSLKYFKDNPPKPGWELMLVIGVVIGALVSAWSGSELTGQLLPDLWQERFGSDSEMLRIGVAFAGGGLMAFGARMAGGCTSGHGISGTLQLAIGSWISAICFFIGGIITAMAMFGI